MVEESTQTVMTALREVIETHGLFCCLYSDRGSHFFVTKKAGDKVDKHRLTQMGRAMRELGVKMIPAYSPQARGRSERNFGTWQGRLPQELRLAKVTTVDGANQFLRDHYIGCFNAQFAVAAAEKGTAFRHREYLAAGGLDFLIGDGRLNYAPEYVWESYYSVRLVPGFYTSFDVQRDTNPAYNHDRGPVMIYSIRLHIEMGLKPFQRQ